MGLLKLSTSVFVLTTLSCCQASPKHWVLIVSGSTGYDNYRHQANACHTYQVLRKNGLPQEQIILMMYDDVATSLRNQNPGTLINRPNGSNVYKGCQVDYSHQEVTPSHFLSVLKGDKLALQRLTGKTNAKVIDSGPGDHIFVTFTGFGTQGLISFPNMTFLYATDFQEAIEWMYYKNKYSKMLVYIEAAFSASIFHNLRDDLNVLAVSSTDVSELGFACYFDEKQGVYLSDTFSSTWLEHSDQGLLQQETVLQQFTASYSRSIPGSRNAHPQIFGNLTIGDFFLSQFQAGTNTQTLPFDVKHRDDIRDAVRVDLVAIEILKKRRYSANSNEKADGIGKLISEEYQMFHAADDYMKEITRVALKKYDSVNVGKILTMEDSSYYNVPCYKAAITATKRFCPGQVNSRFQYVFWKYYVLAKLCNVVTFNTVIDAVRRVSEKTDLCDKHSSRF